MQLFAVIRSGAYTGDVNGEPETAQRVRVLGVYSDPQRANEVAQSDRPAEGWGICWTWVSTVDLDAPPGLD